MLYFLVLFSGMLLYVVILACYCTLYFFFQHKRYFLYVCMPSSTTMNSYAQI